MKSLISVLAVTPLLVVCLIESSALAAAPPGWTREQILDELERRGRDVHSLQADLEQKKWTDILGEFDSGEKGEFRFLRKPGEVYLRKDIRDPQPTHLVIGRGRVTFYQPRIKQAQRHELGGGKDRAEFLLLGFGSSRETLEQTYEIVYRGEENLEGRKTYVLDLTPRSAEVSAYFQRIVLWIDAELWVPIQQKLVEPTEDYLLVEFHNVKLNPKLSPSDFQIKLPKDVHILGQP